MKKRFLLLCLVVLQLLSMRSIGQGKYAGSYKKLVGTTFKDERHFTGFPGHTFTQGDLVSDINDPFQMSLYVFMKKTTALVVFAQMQDTVKQETTILDVIEVKSVPKGWELKTTGCQVGETEGELIVALAKPGKQEYTGMISQAWRINRDKLKFEGISPKNMKCQNQGLD